MYTFQDIISRDQISVDDVFQTPNGIYLCWIEVEGSLDGDGIQFNAVVPVQISDRSTSRAFVCLERYLMGVRIDENDASSSIVTSVNVGCDSNGNGNGSFNVFSYDGTPITSAAVSYSDPE